MSDDKTIPQYHHSSTHADDTDTIELMAHTNRYSDIEDGVIFFAKKQVSDFYACLNDKPTITPDSLKSFAAYATDLIFESTKLVSHEPFEIERDVFDTDGCKHVIYLKITDPTT